MSIEDHISKINELDAKGRCLHFDSGAQCDSIISAHSIQKSGQLKSIVENGHVIHIDPRLGSMEKNNGKLSASEISWKKVSTFNGFCQIHDNELFESIDNITLIPSNEQIMLYAYRCLCREYFVKENAFLFTENYASGKYRNDEFWNAHYLGTKHGFDNLKFHKEQFDTSIATNRYNDIVYACFKSKDSWHTQFSGVLYPDFDFLGCQLQDLADTKTRLELLTFFTAPLDDGWAFVFAWHVSSDSVCRYLLSSLKNVIHDGGSVEDFIFRFSISCCENHAFRKSWWDSLSEISQSEILNRAQLMIAPSIPIPSHYLNKGLENIASWKFENVVATM